MPQNSGFQAIDSLFPDERSGCPSGAEG